MVFVSRQTTYLVEGSLNLAEGKSDPPIRSGPEGQIRLFIIHAGPDSYEMEKDGFLTSDPAQFKKC